MKPKVEKDYYAEHDAEHKQEMNFFDEVLLAIDKAGEKVMDDWVKNHPDD